MMKRVEEREGGKPAYTRAGKTPLMTKEVIKNISLHI